MAKKRIPIAAAKRAAQEMGLNQIILVGWDDVNKVTHVVTWGDTLQACEEAALGGNLVKKTLGFPAADCETVPDRVKRARQKIKISL